MRVLKVTQFYHPFLEKGGPAVKVRAIAERLAGQGHQVTVLTAASERAWAGKVQEVGGVEVIYLRSIWAYRSTSLNPGVVSFCRRRLRTFGLVHIYGLYDLLGPLVAFFCRRWSVPYVLEPMGMYRPIVRNLAMKRIYHRLAGRSLVRGARRVIATSQQEQRELMEENVPREKITLRRNGLELSEFASLPPRGKFRHALGLSGADPLVLYLGRLSRKKGLDLLVRAFGSLPFPAHLAVVGPDDRDGAVEQVERLRAERSLGHRVTLLGPRFGREKLEALVDADLFVLPSQNENFGNAVAEAIACGTPVVLTDRCGIAPLVAGKAGLVVSYDEDSLRDALTRSLQDAALLARLRGGCGEVARALTWEEPIAQMEKMYGEVLQEARTA